MARPLKQGIDYFPLDVDLDHDQKLQMIISEFGFKGEFLWIKLLAYLYENYGYFLPWDEVEQLTFAGRVAYMGSAKANFNTEVVARCVKWGLFDKSVFEATQALTSTRIQETWLDASRKRKSRKIDPKIWLLDRGLARGLSAEQTELIPEVTGFARTRPEQTELIPPETIQTKLKETKEERKKENPVTRGPSYWEQQRSTFLTNLVFFEQFCMSKRLAAAAARALQERFLDDLVLKDDIKDARELQRHFTNWFNKCQQEGLIDQLGNMKNASISEPSLNTLSAVESKTNSILDQCD